MIRIAAPPNPAFVVHLPLGRNVSVKAHIHDPMNRGRVAIDLHPRVAAAPPIPAVSALPYPAPCLRIHITVLQHLGHQPFAPVHMILTGRPMNSAVRRVVSGMLQWKKSESMFTSSRVNSMVGGGPSIGASLRSRSASSTSSSTERAGLSQSLNHHPSISDAPSCRASQRAQGSRTPPSWCPAARRSRLGRREP